MQLLITFVLLILVTSAYADTFTESEEPKWELGAGIGVISLPHYRGSDQRSEYAAPIPYIRYNGKRLKVDKEGGRFYFYNSKYFKLDISTAFSFPVDSDDNLARKGMENLNPIIELGPRMQFNLYQSKDKNLRFRFAMPLREAYDLSEIKSIGWVFSPYLQLRYFNMGWETAVSIGPVWANKDYHDYFLRLLHNMRQQTGLLMLLEQGIAVRELH